MNEATFTVNTFALHFGFFYVPYFQHNVFSQQALSILCISIFGWIILDELLDLLDMDRNMNWHFSDGLGKLRACTDSLDVEGPGARKATCVYVRSLYAFVWTTNTSTFHFHVLMTSVNCM